MSYLHQPVQPFPEMAERLYQPHAGGVVIGAIRSGWSTIRGRCRSRFPGSSRTAGGTGPRILHLLKLRPRQGLPAVRGDSEVELAADGHDEAASIQEPVIGAAGDCVEFALSM